MRGGVVTNCPGYGSNGVESARSLARSLLTTNVLSRETRVEFAGSVSESAKDIFSRKQGFLTARALPVQVYLRRKEVVSPRLEKVAAKAISLRENLFLACHENHFDYCVTLIFCL